MYGGPAGPDAAIELSGSWSSKLGSEAREWLIVLADGLDDSDLRPMAIMTFEALYTSTGMIQMGYEMLDVDKKTIRALAATIWADLRDRDFRPGELRSRAGTLISAIAGWLPEHTGAQALERGNSLLGRRSDGTWGEMTVPPQPSSNDEEATEGALPGLEYANGYMDGVIRSDEMSYLDEEPQELDVDFDPEEFWKSLE